MIMVPGDSSVSELVGAVYDAALQPGGWDYFLALLTQRMKASSAFLMARDELNPMESYYVTRNLSEEALNRYMTQYVSQDQVYYYLSRQPTGHVIASHLLFTAEESTRRPYYHDFLRHYDVFYSARGMIYNNGVKKVHISLQRPRREGYFSFDELGVLRELVPHLNRAYLLNLRLSIKESAQMAMVAVLDRLTIGVILLDERGRVAYVNRRGEHILLENDGLILKRKQVEAASAGEDSQLQGVIHQVVQSAQGTGTHPGGALRITRSGKKQPYYVSVTPIRIDPTRLGMGGHPVCAALFVSDPLDGPDVSRGVLRDLFGLTPTEARLAAALADGCSVSDVSRRFNTSEQTVRTQLKSVFHKTGTCRQTELVKLVLTSPALMDPVPRNGPQP